MNVIKRYFNFIYEAQRDERRATQRTILEHNPAARFLDCGCREGNDTLEFAECIGTQTILGLDYNERVLAQAARRGIVPLLSDLNHHIPLCANSIDVIVASNVLEHLVAPDLFVAELYRVLKPGGYVALETPNLASWHNIFALLLGIQPFSGPNLTTMQDAELGLVQEMHRDDHNEAGSTLGEKELDRHIIVVAYVSLTRLLRRRGFQIDQVRAFGYYPFPPPLARLLQWIDPRHAHHVLFIARKPRRR